MFPAFEDLKITTQTYVVHTNLIIPLEEFFAAVHCVPVNQTNLKKFDVAAETLKDGDIIYIQHRDESKGIEKKTKRKQMLNVVTIVIKYDTKVYNVKVAHSGKIQLTGCKSNKAVIFIAGSIIKILRRNCILNTKDSEKQITCYSICVMSNVNIEIPYKINRDKVHNFINYETRYISILEKSVGYVGVNVKIESDIEKKEESTIEKIVFARNGTYTLGAAKFSDYLATCPEKKKYKKDMYNSFLIFESGKTIMSGCSSYVNRKDAYEIFIGIMENSRKHLCLSDEEKQ